MREKIDYIALGATLFIPASHKNLREVVLGSKYPHLRSLVIDTEDGLKESQLEEAVVEIENLLPLITQEKPYVFLRARNREVLTRLLSLRGVENIHGFVLPKFSLSSAKELLELFKDTSHFIMPSIEGIELFNPNELRELRDILLQYKERVLLIRFGVEDMLGQLSMRRSCEDSLFDLSATNAVLGNLIAVFKSAGFAISGGVYPCYEDEEGFKKDINRDLKEGLFSKTIIHPSQISLADEAYKVSKQELEEAMKISDSKEAVFALNSKMAEPSSMCAYSDIILKRAELYGVRD
jgi:citrate lyase beta subunit